MSSTEYPQPQKRGGALPFGEWMLCGKFGRELVREWGFSRKLEQRGEGETNESQNLGSNGSTQQRSPSQARTKDGDFSNGRVAGSSAREGL